MWVQMPSGDVDSPWMRADSRRRGRTAVKRLAGALLLCALLPAACTGGTEPAAPRAAQTPGGTDPSPTPAPAERAPLERRGAKIENVASGGSHRRARVAIRDLRRIGLWSRLTDHLYIVKIGSRLGRGGVPADGHLADALLTAQVEEEGGGALCDIRFYPTAMADDLVRWAQYYAQRLLPEPPPTLRQFWGAILVHELAHCLGEGKGERVADRWEKRALRGLRTLP
jgi:hypothetical protein